MLFIEDRLTGISEILKKQGYSELGHQVIEYCEDWWELLRQETVLFDVYVNKLIFDYY